MLCEGDAESWDSWSGISKSLVDQFRIDGHDVQVGNVDVDRADRWVAAASTLPSIGAIGLRDTISPAFPSRFDRVARDDTSLRGANGATSFCRSARLLRRA